MEFSTKDWFQFGVPTVLLALLLWQVLPFLKDWLNKLLDTFQQGFTKLENAARDNGNLWRGEVLTMHKEQREDRDKDRELRHTQATVMQGYLSTLQLAVDELSAQKDMANLAGRAVDQLGAHQTPQKKDA